MYISSDDIMQTNVADGTPTLVNLWPAWVVLFVASLVLLNQLLTESEKFANLLGRFGRGIYDRSKRRYQMDQVEFSNAVRTAVAEERKQWEETEDRALTTVRGQMELVSTVAKNQQDQLKEFNFQLNCMRAYVEYEAEWHHKLRMRLLSVENQGLIKIDDLPEHMMYNDFETKCREAGTVSWRTWGLK